MKVYSSRKETGKRFSLSPGRARGKPKLKPSSASQVSGFSHLERLQKRHKGKATSSFPSRRGRNLEIGSPGSLLLHSRCFSGGPDLRGKQTTHPGERALSSRPPREAAVSGLCSLPVHFRQEIERPPRQQGLGLIHRKLFS